MHTIPNPIHSSGRRNVFCPYYDECLDLAVEGRWRSWNCSQCYFESSREVVSGIQTVPDPDVCYELPGGYYSELRY